jgi:thiol-disulfide isomerase/thioredoxin
VERRAFTKALATTLGSARLGIIGSTVQQLACAAFSEGDEGALPSLSAATEWINSPPLTPEGLRGKVVLVDFCTYTCVNWLRTLPYVRAWADKYRNDGLVVIGAHTPEFPFENDIENVEWAAKEMDIRYPIAVDSNYGVWRAFNNDYWPAVYIADVNGRIRFHHFGEAAYDETERAIQRLLSNGGKSARVVSRLAQISAGCVPRRAISVTRRQRHLRPTLFRMRLAPTQFRDCLSTNGDSRVTGLSKENPLC